MCNGKGGIILSRSDHAQLPARDSTQPAVGRRRVGRGLLGLLLLPDERGPRWSTRIRRTSRAFDSFLGADPDRSRGLADAMDISAPTPGSGRTTVLAGKRMPRNLVPRSVASADLRKASRLKWMRRTSPVFAYGCHDAAACGAGQARKADIRFLSELGISYCRGSYHEHSVRQGAIS